MDPILNASQPKPRSDTSALRDLAKELEASFLKEMLKSAGFGEAQKGMGGGIGEEQFASFLVEGHAKRLVDAGGIGLAEHIFDSLKGRSDDA